MMFYSFLTVLIFTSIVVGEKYSAKPARDRFRLMISNIDENRAIDEIEDFTNYRCEKMVVIRNRAQAEFHLTCKSFHDSPKTLTIQPGKAFVFTFRPHKSGETKFWCTVEYKQQYARFDVYNENATHMCPRELDEVYQYTVTHDGVYADGKKGSEGNKIRALFNGHNKYIIWEEYDKETNETDGYLISGLVDGGMCDDIPDQFNDKTAAVTVCYNHCLHLYEHVGCQGSSQTVQASAECVDVPLNDELVGKLSAIKGC